MERKEDLRPSDRWIRPPTKVVSRYAKKQRKTTQFHEDSRKHLQIPANSCRTEELPSPRASHYVNGTYITLSYHVAREQNGGGTRPKSRNQMVPILRERL